MLLSFKFKNFRSFKEEQEVSFVLNSDERSDKNRRFEVETPGGKLRILKNALFYGANASGKSNFFQAVLGLSDLVLHPTQNDNQGFSVNSFAYSKENTKFEIKFLKNNSVFSYLLEYNKTKVVQETLLKNNELIFDRHYQEFDFNTAEPEIKKLAKTVRKTTLTLFFAQNNNVQEAMEAFSWFYDLRNNSMDSIIEHLKDDEDLKEKVLYAMRFADFNILDIVVENNLRPVPMGAPRQATNEEKNRGFGEIVQAAVVEEQQEVYFVHENNGKKFRVFLGSESDGTKRYFGLILWLLGAKYIPAHIVLYDEFDKHLHKQLAKAFIKLLNKEQSQIQFISTTHDSSLMDLLQKHQIYFVEKSYSGESEIFKLSDFEDIGKTRSDARFSAKYDDGRFGAIQIINEAGLNAIMGEENA